MDDQIIQFVELLPVIIPTLIWLLLLSFYDLNLAKRVTVVESLLQKAIAENLGLSVPEAIAAVDRSVAAEAAWRDEHPAESYAAVSDQRLMTAVSKPVPPPGTSAHGQSGQNGHAQGSPGVNLS